MKILQLCHKIPFPPTDGGTIAMNNITQGLLAAGHTVKVLALETQKHPVFWDKIPSTYVSSTAFETVKIDTTISFLAAAKTLFNGKSYQISRFYSKNFAAKLEQLLSENQYDIVHLESIFMCSYIDVIRKKSHAKIVLRTHNVENQIWKRIAKNEHNIVKKLAIKYLASQLERYERSIGSKIDGYATISEPDLRYFQNCAQCPGTEIPFGVDVDEYEPNDEYLPSETPTLFHVGSMNWMPNIEGICWFLDEVWPSILAEFPNVTFTVAGRAIPAQILNRTDKNLMIAGEVPDANVFMLSKDIMVVPLLSGSGVRVKIIEGMALGKTIITTSIGAEGLAVENGKNILIANTPQEFVEAVAKCVHTPDLCAFIGENARNFVSLHHNNTLITSKLIDFYTALL